MKALILAGGSGTRLWPVSRADHPKQFLKIGDEKTFFQKTVLRTLAIFQPKEIFVLTSRAYFYTVKEQLENISISLNDHIILEPFQKNTAPAIAYALKYIIENCGAARGETVLATPSDHVILPEGDFCKIVKKAESLANQGHIVTFGIKPTYPEIGYGYIQGGALFAEEAFIVDRFVEKPDFETAKSYLAAGHFYWNSGIFAFQIGTMLDEFANYSPEIFSYLRESLDFMKNHFADLPNISIDYAVMEKSKKTIVLPLNLFWSDVGSWDNVYDMLPKDEHRNAIIGDVIHMDTQDSLLLGHKRLIAAIGLQNILIVETPDAVLVAKKEDAQKVKKFVSELKSQERKEVQEHITTNRPWGSFTVLDHGDRYKIKKIRVNPGQTLSLQMHYHRSEHWVIVKGTAKVTIGEQATFVHENESIYVPKGSLHRVTNPGKVPLEIIETQVGEYLGEDDIVRFDDFYGRAETGSTYASTKIESSSSKTSLDFEETKPLLQVNKDFTFF